jgi:ABC-2 type transport system permease protein
MSTETLARPGHRHELPPQGSEFTGTLGLLRLYLRRDRLVLPLWVLLLSLPLAPVYIDSIAKLYPTAQGRGLLAHTIMASPAQRALYGNIYNDSLGAVGIWKAGLFHTFIAIAVILTVIRHTRAEEESGRAELIDSTVVGRYAGLTAALILAFGSATAAGLIAAAGLFSADIPRSGSLAFGLAMTGSGLVFSAVAAVAAQLSPAARTGRGIAFGVLGAAFAFRAVGDAGSGALSWLSPLGWSLQVRPYAGDRWWALLLHLATAITLTIVAYRLHARRDVGSGMIAERPGAASASPMLSGPYGLSWRLQRGTLATWTIGLGLYGLLIGSVVHGMGNVVGDSSSSLRDIVTRLGGSQLLENAFITIAFTIVAVAASAMAISAMLRLHHEEAAQHGEAVLAGAVGRIRWALSHILVALGGTAVAMLVSGAVAGITYGIAAHDVGGRLTTLLAVALVQLPAIWILVGVTMTLFGLIPRFTPVAWAILVGFVALYLLGNISGMPQWLLDLVPFAHVPRIPGEGFRAAPIIWLLAIDGLFVTAGLFAFRRRDLR